MNRYIKNNQEQRPNRKGKSNEHLWFLFSVVFLFSFIVYFLFFSSNVFAAKLSNRKITISDSGQSETNVNYTFEWSGSGDVLRCLRIRFCTTDYDPCILPTGMDSTSSTKGTWSGLTASSWTLDNSTNGTLKLTNSSGEAPAASVSLEFLGVTNPSDGGTYYGRITTYSDDTCSTQVDWGPATFTILPSISISATIPSPYATVVFKGKAYPNAFITILKEGAVAATFQAPSNGYFTKTLTGLAPGTYNFSIWAEDTEGRRSTTLSFNITLIGGVITTISGIFLSPTIEINKVQVRRGENLNYKGQSYPSSTVSIYIFSNSTTKKTKASTQGKWNYSFNTQSLERGSHTTRSKAQTNDGEQSTFSETLTFQIIRPCPGADLNRDGRVNLVDFSILLYWWGTNNACADQNEDGKVDLIDFSMMLYYWTG